jgi:uncharacterized protein YndB with AHSA1/START domain
MPPEFECTREVVLPATPEEVWTAVATAAGNAAWLFPNEVDAGGATAWDPPHHLGVRQEQGDWFNALEFVIETRDGGTSVLRYAHSGIFVEDWENQYDAVQQHTDFYLHTLGEYLEHFGGRPVTYIGDVPQGIQGPPSSAAPDSFRKLQQALALSPKASEGDPVGLTPQGLAPLEGVLDYRRSNFLGVRTEDALYRFFGRNAFGSPVGMSIHAFAAVDPERTRRDWQNWLNSALA